MGACLSVGNGTPRMSATMRRKARSVTLAGVKRTAQAFDIESSATGTRVMAKVAL